MSLLSRIIQPSNKRGVSVDPRLLRSPNTFAGVPVNTNSALGLPAVWAAVRVLSETLAQLPLILYTRNGNLKARASSHPLYELLHKTPNPYTTSYHLRQTMMLHLVTWGNAYCEIEWGEDGYPVALWPLRPDRVTVSIVDGNRVYDVELADGTVKRLPAYRVWHVPGLSFDGLVGYSPIRVHMEAIGLGLATQEYGARFFGNGAKPGLVVKHPGTLSDGAMERLKASVEEAHSGLSNAHRVMILEEGMDFTAVGIPPEEAQFLATREFQVLEVARIYRIPPHMLGDMTKTSYASAEELGLQFISYTMMPYLKAFEETISLSLLVGDERKIYFAEFLVDSLLRANTQQRYDAYVKATSNGFMSINEVRALENLNPIEGGDVHLVPLNLTQLGSDPAQRAITHQAPCTCDACSSERRSVETPDDVTVDTFADYRTKQATSFVPLFDDALGRSVRREVKAIGRLVSTYLTQRSAEDFKAKLAEFYKEFNELFVRDFTPLLIAQAQQCYMAAMRELGKDNEFDDQAFRDFINEFLTKAAYNYSGGSQTEIDKAMQSDDPGAVVNEVLAKFEDSRQREWSHLLAFEAFNALLIHSYRTVGVRHIQWVINPGACSFCQRLSGRVVGIEQYFIEAGSALDGEVDGQPVQMQVHGAKRHGPLHSGCSCTVRAVG